ncbi:uncharacterized protein Z518_04891 [Rhinocladiella mackenziei CBS 650.93]|uniref:Heterokaryon incompatibility domain-containing protein n=1 Tax=Rhinocladiella mackenziei CBS 650.93 TaxID=1442369 RepID=A0A0D2JCS1_9EURO|nr:uncharacterized protein Z518_04891 [Rhinocladiella mackenziei CBS 650.93]KIX06915.1 hypothetical protein Z518_04891 [Rhinocladiella mackenziei CBS 650.93]
MWLINTETMKLESVVDHWYEPYAILSHTWGDEEVSFQDWAQIEAGGPIAETLKKKAGYDKIQMTCHLARGEGLKYAWVDTCAIDKSSSAELSEAINSMFKWYGHSHICYAYLSDLESGSELQASLGQCRWFSRGWTLQELIAPQKVRFYDKTWVEVGTKSMLQQLLSEITKVNSEVLRDNNNLLLVPVGRKMSWAACRQTTRIEDVAYCLMGIFGVNMPLLYGEGPQAFTRLQEEIVKDSNDLSLFAWKSKGGSEFISGIFAYSPLDFLHCYDLKSQAGGDHSRKEVTITNIGLRAEGTFYHDAEQGEICILDLACCRGTGQATEWLCVRLEKVRGTFVRASSAHLHTSKSRLPWSKGSKRTIYIRKMLSLPETMETNGRFRESYSIRIRFGDSLGGLVSHHGNGVLPSRYWRRNGKEFSIDKGEFLGVFPLRFQLGSTSVRLVLVCGIGDYFVPGLRGLDQDWEVLFCELDPVHPWAKSLVELAHCDSIDGDEPLTESDRLGEIKDIIFTNLTDHFGSLSTRDLARLSSVMIDDPASKGKKQHKLFLVTHRIINSGKPNDPISIVVTLKYEVIRRD